MFATLASGYPRPDLPADAPFDDVLRATIAEQEAAGLQILSDGGLRFADPARAILARLQGFDLGAGATARPRAIHEPRWDGPIFVRDWETAAALTALPVKQAIVGPYTLGRLVDPGNLTRERLTMAFADALAHELRALVAAGVPMLQVDEPAAVEIGESGTEQQLWRTAHRRLTNTVRDAHLTLAVTGGSIAALPPRVFYDAPYKSFLVDIVTAPANWALLAAAPGERGLILGAADAGTDEADDPAYLAWAAFSAAAIEGRGAERVGLAPSGSLAGRSRGAALAKIDLLARVAADAHQRAADDPSLLDTRVLGDEGQARGWLPPVAATGAD